MRGLSPLGKSLGASLHSLLVKVRREREVGGTRLGPRANWISLC
jgi:hypothetical protein